MAIKRVFLLDDEFPKTEDFIEDDKYSKAISADDLYHLALNEDWKKLNHLQQLIKNIRTSAVFSAGDIQLLGYSNPELALQDVETGTLPDVVIYDWQYGSELNHEHSKSWLAEILETTKAFIFIYSFIEPQLPIILNESIYNSYRDRFQLFLKGGKIPFSFSSEEFIYQYITNSASNHVAIDINGIKVEFKSNNYLSNASDILYLQRILGGQYFLDELTKIDFELNEAGIEKILNDSNGFLLFNKESQILFNPQEISEQKHKDYTKLSYSEVIKKFSLEILESTLERGFFVLK